MNIDREEGLIIVMREHQIVSISSR